MGQSFPLFEGAIGSIAGSFENINVPTFNGLTFGVNQSGNSVMLQVAPDANEKVWAAAAGGAVSVAANWAGGLTPMATNDAMAFTTAITADRVIQIDAPLNLRSVRFDDDNGYTLQGGTLTLQAAGDATAVIQARNLQGNGAHSIMAPISLASDLRIVQQSAGMLTLSGALNNSAGREITKSGIGNLSYDGAQTHGAGAILTVSAGTANINTNAGSHTVRNLTVNANGTTNFGSTQHLAALSVGSGATATISSGGSKSLVTDALTVAGTGKLDLNNHDLIVHATAATKNSVHTEVQAKIVSAQNGFDSNFITNWNGPGLTSTAARSANVASGFDLVGLGVIRNSDIDIVTGLPGSSYTNFSGEPVTPDDVLVMYTYIGDANLDGLISFDDYVGMDNAFFRLIPNLGWATGDINFDGVINFDDYTVVDQAFFFQGAPLAHEDVAAVPEPGAWILFVFGVMSVSLIRRRIF